MRVGIIGAGITGMALTHHLAERGVDVITFESDDEPGGVIQSAEVAGRLLEYGPQRLRLTDGVRTLVEAADLTDDLCVADTDLPLYVFVDGELREVPKTIPGFLRTDALTWRGKVRVLWEPATGPIRDDERVQEAFVRKFGREAYRHLLEPLFGGMYGSDPGRMPANPVLERLRALEAAEGSLLRATIGRLRASGGVPPASFRAGLQALPRALYRRHEPCVHLETPVSAVRADPSTNGYLIEAGGRTADVDRVVLTTPAATTARILDPVLDDGASALSGLTYNSLALVHLEAPAERRGFGYQVARGEGLRTLGVTWNASLFDRDDVYTAFLGGMWDPAALELDDDTLADVASTEFADVMGVEPTVLDVARLPDVMPAFDDTWGDLPDLELPDGITLATNYTGHVGIPSRVREAEAIASELAGALDEI